MLLLSLYSLLIRTRLRKREDPAFLLQFAVTSPVSPYLVLHPFAGEAHFLREIILRFRSRIPANIPCKAG